MLQVETLGIKYNALIDAGSSYIFISKFIFDKIWF